MSAGDLQKQIDDLKRENESLKDKLNKQDSNKYPLSLEEYNRYGRQMIVESTGGVQGQVKLKNSKILVVGAGGLGSPALPYLAAAGIGEIGIVDNDIVEISNLHRQIIHDSNKIGMLKCESAKQVLNKLNPNVVVKTYPVRLNYSNAFDIFQGYDLILDCTDTPLTRYLISDVAVNLNITVVSASGLGTDGQLTILNYKNIGPCYRCFYPKPPPPNSVTSCSSGGVIGPCIGLVGVMMAIETLKILLDIYTIDNFEPFIMMYSGFPHQSLRSFKMRHKQSNCQCCGKEPTVTRETIESGIINYDLFCGSRDYNVCTPDERITVSSFENDYHITRKDNSYILLDVRPAHHYEISHFPNTVNIPLNDLKKMDGSIEKLNKIIPNIGQESEVLVLCRHGNESQIATRLLKDNFKINNVKDIKGGYFAYIDSIDPSIPKY